jgi:hypothetical protein
MKAQSPVDGAIHGVVLDLEGHAVAGAEVRLDSTAGTAMGVQRTAVDGSFTATHLTVGSYLVSITANGFAAAISAPVTVVLSETVEVSATLRVAAIVTTIDVVSGSPADSELEVLPSAGRRWQDAVLTLAGINPDEDSDGLVSSNGLASTANTLLLDGADTTQNFNSVPAGSGGDPVPNPGDDSDSAEQSNGPANGLARGRHAGAAYVFSQAAVQEFRLENSTYSAQTGHAAGAVVTTVSRSGTSALHGALGLVLRSQALAAHDPLAIATSYADGVITSANVKPHDLRESFTATTGGPVQLWRGSRWLAPDPGRPPSLFFFYALDVQRRGFPAISSPEDPAFYALTATQTALLSTRGVTQAQRNAALNYLSSLTGVTPRRADQSVNFGRLDWRRGSHFDSGGRRHGLKPAQTGFDVGLEANRARWTSPAGLVDAPVVARGRASLGNAQGWVDSALLRVTTAVTPSLVSQLRLAYVRDVQYESPQTSLPQEPGIGPGGQAPEVNIAPDGLLFGTPASLSQQAYPHEQRLELDETVTLIHRRHLIEFGGDLALIQDHIATLANADGTFLYDSAGTNGFAGGLVDFVTDYTFNVNRIPNGGCPSINAATHDFCFRTFTQSFGETSTSFPTKAFAAFAEDTFRAGHGLTLHAGARYEYTLLPTPVSPNFALDTLFAGRGATAVFPEDRNNLGPRFSVAWQMPRLGFTVRAGYGMFFGRMAGATILAALAQTAQPAVAASTTRIRITPTAVIACPQAPANGFGYPCDFTAQPGGVVGQTTSAMLFDSHFRLPAVQRGNLTIEHGLPRGTTISAGWVFNLDRQLPSSTDLNIAPSIASATYQLQGGTGQIGVVDGESFKLPLYTTRLTPSFGPVTDIESNANATYHALVVRVASRPAKNLRVQGNFTWAKALDFGPSASPTPRTNNQLDPFTDGYDKGLSSLNYPFSLHANAVWEPAVAGNDRRMRRFFNGWQMAPIVTMHSGRPYSFDLFGGTRLPGGHDSLNGSGGALYLPTIGRNTQRLAFVGNADLRVARGFMVGPPDAHLRLRASVEGFNLLNHRNVSSVQQRAFLVGTPAAGITPLVFQNAAAIATEGLNALPFGTPTAAATSLARERQIQFGLRLEF